MWLKKFSQMMKDHWKFPAEEALNYEHGEVWISTPEDRIQPLSHLGRRVWGQVAGVEQMAPDSVVIFLDPRGVAHFPQWAQIEGECFCPVSYFNDLRIGSPDGWSLMVRGGDPIVDGENIRVHNGEVLELFLTRDPPEPEDPMDGESDSSDDDSEDPSDVRDPLPDSSDFLLWAHPTGRATKGPAAPSTSSRSPRRHSAEEERVQTLSIAAHLPKEQFDLTMLPHTMDELWCLLSPWSGDWMNWSLGDVAMNDAAQLAVKSSRPWQELVLSMGSSPPSLHI